MVETSDFNSGLFMDKDKFVWLVRYDFTKRFYLKTDFSSKGLGFALCQPDSSPEAIAAMKREDAGGD